MSKLINLSNRLMTFSLNKGKDLVAYTKSPRGRAVLMELAPPTPAELPQAFRDGARLFSRLDAWKNVTVREAWLNTLVTTEVICWFFVGEVIGKGTLLGYQV